MNVYRAEQIRNVALIAHGGSGKTSLVDVALYDTGAVTRIGRTDEGSSISDSDPDEIKRRMSINLTVVPVEWKNSKITFLDTPGYADFVGEVMAGLRAADAAVVVVSADKGAEVGTELVWRHADEHELPRLVFVNKLDRENTSYERALESLRSHFGASLAPLTIPIGEQSGLSGVLDLVSGKAYIFAGDKVTPTEVPAELTAAAARYREQLVEAAVENNDDLMAKYLEGEEVSEAELRRAIKQGVAANALVPVLAGSFGKNIGVQPLLDLAPIPPVPRPLSSSRPSSTHKRANRRCSAPIAAPSKRIRTRTTSTRARTSAWARRPACGASSRSRWPRCPPATSAWWSSSPIRIRATHWARRMPSRCHRFTRPSRSIQQPSHPRRRVTWTS